MTEMEKALYADTVWLKGQLDLLRAATERDELAARQEVIRAADELQGTLRKYFGE